LESSTRLSREKARCQYYRCGEAAGRLRGRHKRSRDRNSGQVVKSISGGFHCNRPPRRGTRCDNPTLVTIAEVGHLVLLWRPEPPAVMPADLKRLHKYMLDVEHIGIISDEMREVVEELWPELAHKLTPKRPQGQPQACGIVRNCCSAPRGHDI